jgi:hypothetical protein
MVVVKTETNLFEVVTAAHSPSCFAGGLNRGQQESDKHSDDGDYHQQLDKRKRLPFATVHKRPLNQAKIKKEKNGEERQTPPDDR